MRSLSIKTLLASRFQITDWRHCLLSQEYTVTNEYWKMLLVDYCSPRSFLLPRSIDQYLRLIHNKCHAKNWYWQIERHHPGERSMTSFARVDDKLSETSWHHIACQCRSDTFVFSHRERLVSKSKSLLHLRSLPINTGIAYWVRWCSGFCVFSFGFSFSVKACYTWKEQCKWRMY